MVANVGTNPNLGGEGNLNIQSLQDTNQYKAKQKSVGGSISVGPGAVGGSFNSSNSKTKSNFASVNEQSGIFAGDDGFDLDVRGKTDLKGAVIASTNKAVQDNKNSLNTQTLTTNNINNEAEYKANARGMSIGGGTQSGKPTLSGAGVGSDSGEESSVTVSGISVGAVNINDNAVDTATTVATLNRDVTTQLSTDAEGNITATAVDSNGNNLAATIDEIFDAEKVAKEIQAQVEITQAFGQQAGQAANAYVQAQRTALKNQLENAITDAEEAEIRAQMDEVTKQERIMNVLIGAVTGMGSSALTKEGLSLIANELREFTIENSKIFDGIVDGATVLTNLSGNEYSDGVRGDGIKAGGTRIDLDILCGPVNERCDRNSDNSLKLDDQNRVVWVAEEDNGKPISLTAFLDTPLGKKAAGATGGVQGWKGTLFGRPYAAGSWQDKLIESFGGTHDYIGGNLSGLYDAQGNATRGRSKALKTLQDTWSVSGAIVVSTPFAMAEFLPAPVWQGISILLKGAK